MDFLKWIFTDILYDWPVGTIVGILLIFCIVVIIYLVLWGLYIAIDSWFLLKQKGLGKITGKKFVPAHLRTSYVFNAATKTMMPITSHCPDAWYVEIEVRGKRDSVSITEKFYYSAYKGRRISVKFAYGRLSGNLYIKNIVD